MKLIDIVTYISFILTIVGTFISVISARKSKKYSQAAFSAKQDILNRSNAFELRDFITKAKEIDSIVNSYLVNISHENTDDDLKKILFFLSELNELKSHIPNTNPLRSKLDSNYISIEINADSIKKGNSLFIKSLSKSMKELISNISRHIDAYIYN